MKSIEHNDKVIPADLLEARDIFEHWRSQQEGKRPIPTEFWKLAGDLAKKHKISFVASVLRLNAATLKQKSGIGTSTNKTRKTSDQKPHRKKKENELSDLKLAPVSFVTSPSRVEKKSTKSERPKLVAEVVSNTGISVRMFSGIDELSIKLLSQLIREA